VAPGGIFERLVDGPVSQAAFEAPDTVRQWTFGARVPSARIDRHVLDAGIETGGARDRSSDYVQGTIGELVDRIPARLWTFNAPIAPVSDRRLTTAAAYVTDHISVTPALTVDAGVRLDMTRGSAQGAPAGISWTTVLPRARAAWRVTDAWAPVVFAGVSRSANSLPLDLLAFGDPGAPTASVSQWLPSSPQTLSSAGALVAVVGPGAGTDPAFMRIDPGLKRPTTDELVIGIDAHPSGALTLHGTGFLRRERHLLTLSDPGAPASAFTMIGVPDPGLQLENPVDDQLLPVFDRMPASFGADRYLLTNASGKAATSKSLEISAELHTDHVTLFGGASANQSEAAAAALGFGPLENDQDIVIDAFVDPNAATFARGRLFTDRAYTIKLASVVRLPGDTRVGIAARYQDGQPFSRLVIAPDLNQGAQAIRAFPNGQSRFTFTETVDMRVQKGLAIGQDRLDLVLDVFNLINTGNEIEERVVSGDAFRSVTAVQPVRVFRAGFRIEF
jgi:hypothetical protein